METTASSGLTGIEYITRTGVLMIVLTVYENSGRKKRG